MHLRHAHAEVSAPLVLLLLAFLVTLSAYEYGLVFADRKIDGEFLVLSIVAQILTPHIVDSVMYGHHLPDVLKALRQDFARDLVVIGRAKLEAVPACTNTQLQELAQVGPVQEDAVPVDRA